MNLPYSDSEPEIEELKTQEAGQPIEAEESEKVSSADIPSAEPSTSKPNKINKLL